MYDADETEAPDQYAVGLGDRLRNVRQQQGLSLHDVERTSNGELKASVVGAYERGERAVSVIRLRALADFYRVPISELLPESSTASRSAGPGGAAGLRLDLTRLGDAPIDGIDIVERFATTIQGQRGDYNGRVLTIRAADLQSLAAVLDMGPDTLGDALIDAGVATVTA